MEYYYSRDRMPSFLLDRYYSQSSQEYLLRMCDFSSKKSSFEANYLKIP